MGDTEQRIVERFPAASDDERWQGRVLTPGKTRTGWKGRHIESVIQQMDKDLGAWPEEEYTVTE